MASENDKDKSEQAQASSDSQSQDSATSNQELPSLDQVLSKEDSGQADVNSANTDTQASESNKENVLSEEITSAVAEVDKILEKEDPEFLTQVEDIKKSEFQTNVDLEATDIEGFLTEGEKSGIQRKKIKKEKLHIRLKNTLSDFFNKWQSRIHKFSEFSKHALKSGFKLSLKALKFSAVYSLAKLKAGVQYLLGLSLRTKLSILASLILAAGVYGSLYLAFKKKHYLPEWKIDYLVSMADIADESFDYDPNEPKESFESEIRNPEHIFEVERIVANLKQTHVSDHIPMGLFEFYLEANSNEAIIEIGDRRQEARHVILRVLEQMTYEELTEIEGKKKLKLILKKELNSFLTQGHQVRQIYFKTIVLKP